MAEREEISRGLARKLSLRDIAKKLGRAPSTICREVNRNGGVKSYRANKADKMAWKRALRPKACNLSGNRSLIKIIIKKLKLFWSPEQISGWLKRQYPNNERLHVSHETIYRMFNDRSIPTGWVALAPINGKLPRMFWWSPDELSPDCVDLSQHMDLSIERVSRFIPQPITAKFRIELLRY